MSTTQVLSKNEPVRKKPRVEFEKALEEPLHSVSIEQPQRQQTIISNAGNSNKRLLKPWVCLFDSRRLVIINF